MKKAFVIFVVVSLAYLSGWAQQSATNVVKPERPVRIGLKVGLPNLVGLNVEYVTPWLGGRLAPTIDLTIIPHRMEETVDSTGATKSFNLTITYWEAGLNYYFSKLGQGWYGNVSYGRLSMFVDALDFYDAVQPTNEWVGKIDATINFLNFKVGGKLGKTIYFRPELGFALASLQNGFNYTTIDLNGNTEVVTEEASGLLSLIPIINIGLGVAF
ncbi:MAG: hypothetical protein WBA23_21120 [Tunicatimonas sp.]|uniref:hypothetical protein n=1 Tax=Tunicatimonas sp. TaxID=1940096 RepID=UPI003C70E56A